MLTLYQSVAQVINGNKRGVAAAAATAGAAAGHKRCIIGVASCTRIDAPTATAGLHEAGHICDDTAA